MLKKLIAISLLTLGLLAPRASYAKTVCTQDYGQPVKCVEEEEPVLGAHVPVEAGLADNLALAAGIILASSGVLYFLAKRTKSSILA